MRKLYITILSGLLLGLSSCADTFLDLEPQDKRTNVVYFKKPADFKEYATGFYNQLLGWRTPYGKYSIYEFMDSSSDLAANFVTSSDVGRGTISISSSDERWDQCYTYIRTVNILFEKAKDYPGSQSEIAPYLAEAYFFRAYNYFTLLKAFGGVPVVTSVMDTDSPELRSPRNSRYEVIDLILSDLTNAIASLPIEQNIPETEKGRVSKWAAEAFKARVLLYEATWRKYNGTSTDFEGSAGPARDQVNEFLEEAISLCDDVMKKGGYQIWNYNSNDNRFDGRCFLEDVEIKLQKRLEEIGQSLSDGQKEIDNMQEYYWENYTEMDEYGYEDYDNQQALLHQVNANNEKLQLKHRFEKMLDAPFFGRVDFMYDGDDEPEPFYIGIANFAEKTGMQPLIYDWRAPVSSLFYDYDKGPASYEAPAGRLDGEILSKWQFKIQNGELVYAFESDTKIDDDILKKELGTNSDVKLKISSARSRKNRMQLSEIRKIESL